MKHNKLSQQQTSKPISALAAADLNQNGIHHAPSVDEVAKRAYFSYQNLGSRQGHDVQHWLAAESELIAERKINLGSRLS